MGLTSNTAARRIARLEAPHSSGRHPTPKRSAVTSATAGPATSCAAINVAQRIGRGSCAWPHGMGELFRYGAPLLGQIRLRASLPSQACWRIGALLARPTTGRGRVARDVHARPTRPSYARLKLREGRGGCGASAAFARREPTCPHRAQARPARHRDCRAPRRRPRRLGGTSRGFSEGSTGRRRRSESLEPRHAARGWCRAVQTHVW